MKATLETCDGCTATCRSLSHSEYSDPVAFALNFILDDIADQHEDDEVRAIIIDAIQKLREYNKVLLAGLKGKQ